MGIAHRKHAHGGVAYAADDRRAGDKDHRDLADDLSPPVPAMKNEGVVHAADPEKLCPWEESLEAPVGIESTHGAQIRLKRTRDESGMGRYGARLFKPVLYGRDARCRLEGIARAYHPPDSIEP